MKFGITQTFSCSYLPQHDEQLLVYAGDEAFISARYSQLIQFGFRRSGEQIYRPHCPDCNACESVRIPVDDFSVSKSQRRVNSRNKIITTKVSYEAQSSYYPLYEQYISTKHNDGSMYPPSVDQFNSFITCKWMPPIFIEAYIDEELIAVAVTDVINKVVGNGGLSALYTFYDPVLTSRSIGTYMILQQIEYTKRLNLAYLYLGYQVDGCKKMNYKTQFFPHERFSDGKWCRIEKKSA